MRRLKIWIIISAIVIGLFLSGCAAVYAQDNTLEAVEQDDLMIIKLKVLTLNIHGGVNWYGKYDLDGIMNFIASFNPDLVGLQEVDRCWSSKSQFEDIPGQLALGLGMFSSYSVSLARNNGYFGNLILSKHPINVMWADQLPGNLERRSFVYTQIEVQGIRINFITVHLGLSISDRLQQMAALMQLVRQINGPLIIAGDFNAHPEDDLIIMLKDQFIDLQDLTGNLQGTFRGDTGTIGPLIDHIFVTPEFKLANFQIINNYVSDHLPLTAELILQVDPRFVH